MSVIVCDAGPIIHLYEARCLPLLRQTGNLFVPSRVYLEVQTAVHMETQWPDWLRVVKLSLNEQNEAGIWQAAGGIHAGEAEALVLARQKKADWFLTDDAATRLFVSLLGMEVHGSLGVILWSAAHRHLNRKETEDALKRIEQSSLWLSPKIYQEAWQALDEIYAKDQ
jgi:predicted nucleic acid-binding protein